MNLILNIAIDVSKQSYQLALSMTSAPVVNIVSSTSGLFTLILTSIFPTTLQDRFSMMKFILIIVSVGLRFQLSYRSYIHHSIAEVEIKIHGVGSNTEREFCPDHFCVLSLKIQRKIKSNLI